MLIAKGVGATHLGPGTIDVLGYARRGPGRGAPRRGAWRSRRRAPVRAPRRRRRRRAERRLVQAPVRRRPAARLRLPRRPRENVVLPTTVGARKPSAVVPETMAAGDLRDDAPMLVVGFYALRDFHAAYLADNVARGGVPARSVVIEARVDGRPEANSLGLRGRWRTPTSRGGDRRRQVGRGLGGAAAGRLPRRPRRRGPHGVWQRPPGAARAAGVRGPDAAAVGARDARLQDAARRACARAAGGSS